MWLSWRPKQSIALVESKDGIHWSEPPRSSSAHDQETGWEDDINRPVVLKRADGYHMWYTGQANGHSWIGYATSPDGMTWKRMSDKPVLSPEKPWERWRSCARTCSGSRQAKLFRMWYSGGEQYEPNAIGYATSPDGLPWTKHAGNPVFSADPNMPWEQARRRAARSCKRGDWYMMFYIGFRDMHHAQIGLARSQGRHHRLAAPPGQPDHPSGHRTSGTTTPATSPTRSSTARNGCSGTTAATAAWNRSAWSSTRARTSVSIGYPQSLDGPRSYNLQGSVTTTVWFSVGAGPASGASCRRRYSATMSYSKSSAAAGNGHFIDSAGDMPGSNLLPLAVAQRPHPQGHRLHGLPVQGNNA